MNKDFTPVTQAVLTLVNLAAKENDSNNSDGQFGCTLSVVKCFLAANGAKPIVSEEVIGKVTNNF